MNKIMTRWMGIFGLFLVSCQTDDITAPVITDDVLAMMPADTPVGIFAEVEDENGKMQTSRTGGETYYAQGEIHDASEVNFMLYVPGASSENNRFLSPKKEDGSRKTIPFKDLANTEPFSKLMLKDFNLVEGDNRNVSRWTILNARYNNGQDNLCGWARLKADDNGMPVLDYGEMKRINAKMTIVIQDEKGGAVVVSDNSVNYVEATLSLPKTNTWVIYTPEGETKGKDFDVYCSNITALAEDAAIDANRIGLAMYADEGNEDITLDGMVNADGSSTYFGADNNMLSAIVPATPTHTCIDRNYTAITPTFTGTEKLTITVADNYPGLTGSQTGGTYSLKLKDVKLSDGSNLTALKSGEHYTLTVTLRHNTLVSATATISTWSTASANATLEGDGAKLPDNDNTNE